MNKSTAIEYADRLTFVVYQLKGLQYLMAQHRDEGTPLDIDEIRHGIAIIFENIIKQAEVIKDDLSD